MIHIELYTLVHRLNDYSEFGSIVFLSTGGRGFGSLEEQDEDACDEAVSEACWGRCLLLDEWSWVEHIEPSLRVSYDGYDCEAIIRSICKDAKNNERQGRVSPTYGKNNIAAFCTKHELRCDDVEFLKREIRIALEDHHKAHPHSVYTLNKQ